MKDYDGFWFTFIRKKMWDLQTVEVQLNDKEMKILELIINDNKISYEKICSLTNYSYSTVSRTINTLKQKNKIKFFGSKKTGKWIVISEKLV